MVIVCQSICSIPTEDYEEKRLSSLSCRLRYFRIMPPTPPFPLLLAMMTQSPRGGEGGYLRILFSSFLCSYEVVQAFNQRSGSPDVLQIAVNFFYLKRVS